MHHDRRSMFSLDYYGMFCALLYDFSTVFLRTPSRERGKTGLLSLGLLNYYSLSGIARKPVLGFPSRSDTNRLYSHRRWLEASNFQFRKWRDCTAQLICAFCFCICKNSFSHEVALLLLFVCRTVTTYFHACYNVLQ